MRTTIDLPDELFRQAKAQAALSGITLKELITRFVERGLREPEPTPEETRAKRTSLPYVVPAAGRDMPNLSNFEIEEILAAEEAELDAGNDDPES